MLINIITLFPDMFNAITKYGPTKKAIKKKIIKIKLWNIRHFSNYKNKKIDDYQYGGGSGMIMMIQPLKNAIRAVKKKIGFDAKVIYLSPKGKKLNHQEIKKLTKNKKIIIICGRYKGIDERIIKTEINLELSIGDYVTSGGELPSMILIDSMIRLIPGVINKKSSIINDSFYHGILDHPHYTKPIIYNGIKVPSILLTGNHDNIRKWRLKQSLGHTWLKRPDLLNNISLNIEQKKLIKEFKEKFFKKYTKNYE